MGTDHVKRFEGVLLEIGTRGLAARAEALRTLGTMVPDIAAKRRADVQQVLREMGDAGDFVALWRSLQAFAPFLSAIDVTREPVVLEPPEEPDDAPPEPLVPVAPPPVSQPSLAGSEALQDFSWQAPPLPEEMLADFFAEVNEHLDEVAQLVLRVDDPDGPDMYELYRKLHTVKGNSGMVGLGELQDVAHGMEDVVKELRSRKESLSDLLRKVLADGAELAATILNLAEEGGEGRLPIAGYLSRLRSALAGKADPPATAPPVPAPPEAPAEPMPSPPLAASVPASPAAPATGTADGARRPAAGGKRMLRVDFEQVDQLAALVGEQAVRQEEVGKFVERMEEGVESLHRQLKDGTTDARTASRQMLEQARQVSKDLAGFLSGLEGTSQALELVSGDIQRTVLNLRMTPLEALFSKHRMTVFQAANAQGKKAQLVIEAGDAKLDKSLAEKLEEPLIHLIRNAVSHGIQSPEERVAQGKPAEGTVTVRAFHQGNQVVVQVEDDGVGIVADVIRRKAVEKGFLTEEESQKRDDRRIVDMIFAPGFSTTTRVDDVSGRGVGLDVVRDKLNRINGAIEIISEQGKGTIFQLTLPLTLALARVLLADVAGETTALPADSVLRVETLSPSAVVTVDGRQMVRLAEETLPLVNLASTLGLSRVALRASSLVTAIATFGTRRAALLVDRVLLPTQAVVREVGPVMPAIRHCMGVTFHEGHCVLIIDVGSVIRAWRDETLPASLNDVRQSHCIVTRRPSHFLPLGRLAQADLSVTLVHPERLDAPVLKEAAGLYLDSDLEDLEAIAEACGGRASGCRLVVLAEGGSLASRQLDRLYDAGAEDVWPLTDGWPALLRRLGRGGKSA